MGTKTLAILSARAWIGAFDPCASSTILTMLAMTVSLPTAVALNSILPFLFSVPPVTFSPAVLSTGRASPVTSDSSIDVSPLVMIPSTGIFSPGRTIIVSLTSNSETGISISPPFLLTLAILGCRSNNFLIASVARFLAPDSSTLPMRMRVVIVAAESK